MRRRHLPTSADRFDLGQDYTEWESSAMARTRPPAQAPATPNRGLSAVASLAEVAREGVVPLLAHQHQQARQLLTLGIDPDHSGLA